MTERKWSRKSAALELCRGSTFDEAGLFPMMGTILKKRKILRKHRLPIRKVRLCRRHGEICFILLVGRNFPSLNVPIHQIGCLIRKKLFEHCLYYYL